jgi:hypothetical protein
MEGVSKRALQWYFKCYCVAIVTETFTLKDVQSIQLSTPRTMDSLYTFECKGPKNHLLFDGTERLSKSINVHVQVETTYVQERNI